MRVDPGPIHKDGSLQFGSGVIWPQVKMVTGLLCLWTLWSLAFLPCGQMTPVPYLDNMIMTVAHMANVVDTVKKFFVSLVVHVLAFSPDNFDRVGLEKKLARCSYMLIS